MISRTKQIPSSNPVREKGYGNTGILRYLDNDPQTVRLAERLPEQTDIVSLTVLTCFQLFTLTLQADTIPRSTYVGICTINGHSDPANPSRSCWPEVH